MELPAVRKYSMETGGFCFSFLNSSPYIWLQSKYYKRGTKIFGSTGAQVEHLFYRSYTDKHIAPV